MTEWSRDFIVPTRQQQAKSKFISSSRFRPSDEGRRRAATACVCCVEQQQLLRGEKAEKQGNEDISRQCRNRIEYFCHFSSPPAAPVHFTYAGPPLTLSHCSDKYTQGRLKKIMTTTGAFDRSSRT